MLVRWREAPTEGCQLVDYFFIGGAPKSGTTWIQRTLDLHPEIVCSGEGHLHQYIVRPLADTMREYNKKLAAVGDLVYEGRPYLPALGRNEQLAMLRVVLVQLLGRRTKPGARLFGDKTPANARIVEDFAVILPGSKFIGMLRDPRDVAASRLGHAKRTGHTEAEQADTAFYLEVVKAAALDWQGCADAMRKFAKERPDQSLSVRYEDLIADPHAELRRVFGYLGVQTPEPLLAEIVEQSRFEAFSGGRARGVENGASFYRKGVVGDWRNQLTADALAIVLDICGEAMGSAGYDVEADAEDEPRTSCSRG
jgi:hypothetical protein